MNVSHIRTDDLPVIAVFTGLEYGKKVNYRGRLYPLRCEDSLVDSICEDGKIVEIEVMRNFEYGSIVSVRPATQKQVNERVERLRDSTSGLVLGGD